MSLFSAPTSAELGQHIDQQITVRGWLHTLRLKGQNLAFLILRDRDGLMQIVLENPDEIEKLRNMLLGTVIAVTWTIVPVPKGKFQYEMQGKSLIILQPVTHPTPIDISKDEVAAEYDTIHDNKVVYLRHPRQVQIFKLVAQIEKAVRVFFDAHKFTQMNTPKILGAPTEGGAEVFKFPYFDQTACLAQSPQFYKQMMCGSFERVYEIGKAYRAEKSNTSRHTTEIVMIDAEMAFIDSFNDVLTMAQGLIQSVVEQTRAQNETALLSVGATKPILTSEFPRISMDEVHELMFAETGKDHRWELDLAPEEEIFICKYMAEKKWSDAVFVEWFPRSDAKFYHKQHSTNPVRADRADLLFRGVEIATVTRREVNYDKIIQQFHDRGIDPTHPWFAAFLDGFKYGMPEQGGFGMWLARLAQKILGLSNVKDADLFPRDMNRLTP